MPWMVVALLTSCVRKGLWARVIGESLQLGQIFSLGSRCLFTISTPVGKRTPNAKESLTGDFAGSQRQARVVEVCIDTWNT